MIDGLKPYDDYRPSAHPWLGKVPAHWLEKRAKYFFREVDERSTTGEEDLLSVSHKTGVTPRPQHVTMFKAESNVGHKICRPADLAINTMWAFMGALGVSKQVGVVSPSYGVYRPINDSELHPNYVDRLLRTDDYKSEYLCRSTGIRSSRLRLYPDEFLKIPIPCPPSEEQAAIVRFLDHADRRIRRYIRAKRQLIALLNEQKQAIIHRAVTRGLDPHVKLKPSGVEWIEQVPEGWRVLALKRCVRTKITDGPHETPIFVDDGVDFLSAEAMVGGGFVFERRRGFIRQELHERYCQKCKPQLHDIFMCKSGATTGKVAMVRTEKEFSVWSPLALIRPTLELVLPDFLFLALQSEYVQKQVQQTWSQGTQPNLSMGDMSRLAISIPPVAQQQEILDHVHPRLRMCDRSLEAIVNEIEFVREYRTRLIADVVTGKLDVREAAAALPDELEAVEPDAEELLDEDDTTDDVELDTEPEEVEA